MTGSIAGQPPVTTQESQPIPPVAGSSLAGRTLVVSDNAEIVLRPREVVLTFDDGPRPGRTEAILATLDNFGVKATFLMLGEAAERHPALVQRVAQHGHAIGSHTFTHARLTGLSNAEALAEMQAGYAAVARALAGTRYSPSRFFRFPYLAQNGLIRASAISNQLVILDVDIDSKDYFKDSPQAVLQRTLARVESRGQGIILFHDIHARTVAMLPDFLEQLQARGYKVVSLKTTGGPVFDQPLITAQGVSDVQPL